jgi:RimJ/RimL family protein N-acetyltransferase
VRPTGLVTIRNATQEDLVFLAELARIRDATQEDLAFLVEVAEGFRQGEESPALGGWMESDDAGVVAEDEQGRPIGAAWYRRQHCSRSSGLEPPWWSREIFVGVVPAHRGRGIAKQLVGRLIDKANEDRHVEVLVALPAPESEEARRLCLHFGFQDQGDGQWLLLR